MTKKNYYWCYIVNRFQAASRAFILSKETPDEKVKTLMKDFIYLDAEKVTLGSFINDVMQLGEEGSHFRRPKANRHFRCKRRGGVKSCCNLCEVINEEPPYLLNMLKRLNKLSVTKYQCFLLYFLPKRIN